MSIVPHIYKKYVKGTPKKAIVQFLYVFLCHLTSAVMRGAGIECSKVYVNTRVVKHIYDKRPAEEFYFCIENIQQTVKYPDRVYKNKNGKRGEFCFVKSVKNSDCLASVQIISDEESGKLQHCEIVTFFRPDPDYLKNYELLWEWKGGTPSS